MDASTHNRWDNKKQPTRWENKKEKKRSDETGDDAGNDGYQNDSFHIIENYDL